MNFTNYSTRIDFDGIKIDLPKRYKYISRDKYGFIAAWIKKPSHDEFGAGDGSEYPITLGHQKGIDLKPVLRKYRMKSDGCVTYITGEVIDFK